jgi:hypothetical protein
LVIPEFGLPEVGLPEVGEGLFGLVIISPAAHTFVMVRGLF